MSSERADSIFQRVLATGDSRLADNLLQEFVGGYPLEQLRLLLRHRNPDVASTGAFIAAELGHGSLPLIDEFLRLVNHDDARVRREVLDCILVCATDQHGHLIAQAIGLVRDPERGIRWKAIVFLSRASRSQLQAAVPFLSGELQSAVAWLGSERSSKREEIELGLRDDDRMKRTVAAAAAARHPDANAELVEAAAATTDEDIALFANSELRSIRRMAAARTKRDDRLR